MSHYRKLYTAQDSAIVFIDHQPQMTFGGANIDDSHSSTVFAARPQAAPLKKWSSSNSSLARQTVLLPETPGLILNPHLASLWRMNDTRSQPLAPNSGSNGEARPAGPVQFVTTQWTAVLTAGRSDSTHAQAALEQLCRAYWHPLYAFVRRQGHDEHDAQDLTQEFFVRLLEKHYLGEVEREKGRFRSFLLAAMKHFLANEWHRANAQKRGGGQKFVPLDAEDAETRYGVDPAHLESPDRLFERRWALTLLDLVLARLRAEHEAAGKAELFDALKGCLTGDRAELPYAELGSKLGLSEGAVKVAVHRLRQRYRGLLRAEVAHTVASEQDVEDELRHLFHALAG